MFKVVGKHETVQQCQTLPCFFINVGCIHNIYLRLYISSQKKSQVGIKVSIIQNHSWKVPHTQITSSLSCWMTCVWHLWIKKGRKNIIRNTNPHSLLFHRISLNRELFVRQYVFAPLAAYLLWFSLTLILGLPSLLLDLSCYYVVRRSPLLPQLFVLNTCMEECRRSVHYTQKKSDMLQIRIDVRLHIAICTMIISMHKILSCQT